MSRFQNIQKNKFKIILPIREERKAQQPRKFNRFQSMLGKLYNAFNPLNVSTHIHITQEDIDKDLNEGRG